MMKKAFFSSRIVLLAILFFFLNFSFAGNSDLKKVEPPFWWIGMEVQELQLLVYGNNISGKSVEINYQGVELIEVVKTENPNYLFLNLVITEKVKAGIFQIKFKNNNKIVHSYDYELKERKAGSKERKGFNSSDAIYLIMPDRFSNGNPENDNMPGMIEKANRDDPNGRHGGDIKGITNQIDYFKELGITTLWLNPVLENNMPKYSYHGYAITDFYKVDSRFGTNEDYKNLIDDCHKKGLKMIMDMVFNHCGSYHWWMKDLPQKDWVHQFTEFTRSNYRAGTVADPHASQYDKTKMLSGWFDTSMPDLNQKNKLLANYLIQNSIWWIECFGLDGIRMDTYPYSYKEFMADWMNRINIEYPNFNVVGESWLSSASAVAYWQKNANNRDSYESHLPSVFDFPLMFAIGDAFIENNTWDKGIVRLYDALGQDFLYGNPDKLVVFADNHDTERFFSKIAENYNDFKNAMTFLLTTRGIPLIYYGTEILMTGHENRGHGDIRKDFPGGWKVDKKNAFTKEDRNHKQNDAFNFIKNLLNYRKNNKVVQTGKLVHFIPENGVYVYFRYNDENTVMVIISNNDKLIKLETESYSEILKNYSTGTNILNGQKIDDLENINIAPKSSMVVELK